MNNLIVSGIKRFLEANCFNQNIYEYLDFYDKLRDIKEVKLIYEELQIWLEKTFYVKSLKIVIDSLDEKDKEIAFQNSSDEVYENSSMIKKYKIFMNKSLAINFYLVCENKKHLKEITSNDEILNAFFYMVAPFITSVSYQELVQKLTFKDPLTSVYNRKFLVEHLNKLLPLAKRENKNISFLMIGIDHFKAVIDEFDYDVGDNVLISLSEILRNNIRESDIVVRLEADEFLVTLVGLTSQNDAKLVAQKLIDVFAKSEVKVSPSGYTLKKTICVGITHYDNQTNSVDYILRNADISLYEAKNLGRSKIKEFFPDKVECVDLF
ncbi:diguanylate cyclase [Arcobacter nitrofigilis DSM 7299]|uniref:diguanylate cyclase n=1 Tax=Arcobacter nitrofigilis (strain ATCC 33309 / DSM 7299 / CCUG 15893 / LMG 7604 / NCTC 12251 / CI) TaxID=572480 RepID=D5V4Q2_ARCNC|nr:GGDEF domain-containing protein [Arcobacter nitrofigilis]ADG92957.1 diguanylate cyclase [Arcobacter nitrofigilis DSM 7299]